VTLLTLCSSDDSAVSEDMTGKICLNYNETLQIINSYGKRFFLTFKGTTTKRPSFVRHYDISGNFSDRYYGYL
jgi:hypothetical protein